MGRSEALLVQSVEHCTFNPTVKGFETLVGRENDSTFLLGSYTKEKEENGILLDKGL